mgnify:CR=1 FL=1
MSLDSILEIFQGINTFIEIGPGNTLCGLAKKISHELVTMNIEDVNTLNHTIETLKSLISGEAAVTGQEG